jgi:putative phosphoribosyl transferase
MRDIKIDLGSVELGAYLELPARPRGLVIFAHGSGSSRHSPRNHYVARLLNGGGLGTLLADLLTEEESADRRNVFDIRLLAERLASITDWVTNQPELSDLPLCYFGASTGAAAALSAAASLGERIQAVVSRGGRPDLAEGDLAHVDAPTLLIVGGKDTGVIELNERAATQLICENKVEIVPNATHLFEEPGTLDEVARLATLWFRSHILPPAIKAKSEMTQTNSDLGLPRSH